MIRHNKIINSQDMSTQNDADQVLSFTGNEIVGETHYIKIGHCRIYTEIRLSDEQSDKLKKWEDENGKDVDYLVQDLLLKFIDELPK
ncbi:hypothetical protein [Paenibacillus rhizophilus]|uniref:Uncharacterized protein n=1 Tax=Paenibacillus rhizophilus TaxID=1850366 RepID=A0A3N9P4Q9_9BACL|nr:hypothetical protein [Paenibacillus rhizophilus]RQW10044.1 hypothetical protein EH198_16550 [Paenibacillus rhizophilus]